MKLRLSFALLLPACLALMQATVQPGVAAGTPTITIQSPQNGATVSGPNVTLRVSVSNFKLVPPIYINPPKLAGDQGHIHYVLDGLRNFVAKRDATVSLSHTWSNVSPGRHILIAYLATSQHAQFPGTQAAKSVVTVTLLSPAKHPPQEQPARPISSAPGTGGGAGRGGGPLNLLALLIGLAAIALGLLLRVSLSLAPARLRAPRAS